jgi:peroxiredoxin family protein
MTTDTLNTTLEHTPRQIIATEPQRRGNMTRMAIVIRDDSYDRLLTPLTFAAVQAGHGVQVDVLFVLWAARVLTHDGVRSVKIDGRHAHEEAWLRDHLAQAGDPVETHDFLKLLKHTGKVNLYACRLAAATFGVNQGNLIPEADGIVDSAWFLNEIVQNVDHCQYF